MDHYSTFFCLPPVQLSPRTNQQPSLSLSISSSSTPNRHEQPSTNSNLSLSTTATNRNSDDLVRPISQNPPTTTTSTSNNSSTSSHSSPHSSSSPPSPLPNSSPPDSSSGSEVVLPKSNLGRQSHPNLNQSSPTNTTSTARTNLSSSHQDSRPSNFNKILATNTDHHHHSRAPVESPAKSPFSVDHRSETIEPCPGPQISPSYPHSQAVGSTSPNVNFGLSHNYPQNDSLRSSSSSSSVGLLSESQPTPPSSHRLVSRIPSRISTSQANSYSSSSLPLLDRPRRRSIGTRPGSLLPSPDLVQAACDELMARDNCFATAVHSLSANSYGFRLSGSFPQVMAARGRLLREQPFEVEKVVAAQRADVLQGGANVPPAMKVQLDEIASSTRAHLSIVGSGDGSEGEVDIVARGDQESTEEARIRLLILLDQLNGLHLEVCEIDYKLHHIIAGRKRSVIQSIQEETATNIYFPSLLSGGGILGARHPTSISRQNMIIITGEFFGAQRAREMLFQVSMHKSKCIISRDTAMLPRKLDWMLMEKLATLQQIMYDNGTFINFPPIGSQISVVSVYGDNRVQVERTIRTLMQLACEFYTADVWLLPGPLNSAYQSGSHSSLVINPNEIASDGHRIALESGAEIVFKSTNSFEVYGTDRSVKKAIEKILELDLARKSQVEIRFQVELACEHRDFISGKKNGKLNKIMKTSNVKIKFESFNDYNFLIDVSGDSTRAMIGLRLLEEELPAEISFHIPEGYHKRIIGVGGKNIQRIMKKYGVYVKFTNAEEFASLGGYLDNHDNVVARTPAKNSGNLQNLKLSVMELVHPNDKDFVTESMTITRQHHRTILAEKSIFIHDIELKTNTCFYFPSSESGLDTVAIFGPQSQIAMAREMMVAHLGLETDYKLRSTPELWRLVKSEEFQEKVTKKLKRNWGVNVSVLGAIGEASDLNFKFALGRANPDNLKRAKESFETFLTENKVNFRHEHSFNNNRSYHQRRSTVTSIGSVDRATSAGTFTPITPTDPYSFHHSSDADLDSVLGRHVATQKHITGQNALSSSTTSSPSSFAYHPSLSVGRLYNPLVGLNSSQSAALGGPRNGSGSFSDWKASPRQVSRGAIGSSILGSIGSGPSPQAYPTTSHHGLRGGASTSHLQSSSGALGELSNRRLMVSPRAQSIDLGKPSVAGNMLMINPFGTGSTNNFLGGGSAGAIGSAGVFSGSGGPTKLNLSTTDSSSGGGMRSSTGGAGAGISEMIPQGDSGGLHRHRFSQGTISSLAYEQNLMNGFGGLNLR